MTPMLPRPRRNNFTNAVEDREKYGSFPAPATETWSRREVRYIATVSSIS
jgi:hypothetical protein